MPAGAAWARPREQPKLQVEDVVHDLDDADKTCPTCGGDLEEWEGQFEEGDEVEVVERRYVIKHHKRKKVPPPLRELRRYRAGAAASDQGRPLLGVLRDHRRHRQVPPLERQGAAMARLGLEVDSQTLFD